MCIVYVVAQYTCVDCGQKNFRLWRNLTSGQLWAMLRPQRRPEVCRCDWKILFAILNDNPEEYQDICPECRLTRLRTAHGRDWRSARSTNTSIAPSSATNDAGERRPVSSGTLSDTNDAYSLAAASATEFSVLIEPRIHMPDEVDLQNMFTSYWPVIRQLPVREMQLFSSNIRRSIDFCRNASNEVVRRQIQRHIDYYEASITSLRTLRRNLDGWYREDGHYRHVGNEPEDLDAIFLKINIKVDIENQKEEPDEEYIYQLEELRKAVILQRYPVQPVQDERHPHRAEDLLRDHRTTATIISASGSTTRSELQQLGYALSRVELSESDVTITYRGPASDTD